MASLSTAFPPSAVARGLAIKTIYQNQQGNVAAALPQRVGVFGQGSSSVTYPLTKATYTTALAVAETYGFGCPLHLAALELLPVNGDGLGVVPMTIYPLEDAATAAAATGDITPAGVATVAASYQVSVNNILSQAFVVSIGDTVAQIVTAMTNAINANLNMPVTASDNTTDVQVVSKWKGVSANDLVISIVASDADTGVTFGITQPTGGLVNPDVSDALAQIGDVWETAVLNCLNIGDTATLNLFQDFGEGRWSPLVRKPLFVLTGNPAVDVTTAIAVPETRKLDRVNGQVPAMGSDDLPFVIASRALARIAVRANENPPYDYGSLDIASIVPGPDAEAWSYVERDQAVKGGSSTVQIKSGALHLSDIVTFYHPDGDPLPAYRYIVDIVKLQNVIYDINNAFDIPEWDGAPLLNDADPTVNPDAKKPKMAKALAASRVEALGLAAILANAEQSAKDIQVEIDANNPKRLNMAIPVKLVGNTNILSIDLLWSFNFGTPTILA